MLKFVPDYLKTKMMCNNAAKKLLFARMMFQIDIILKKCVVKLFQKIVEYQDLFLTAGRTQNDKVVDKGQQ